MAFFNKKKPAPQPEAQAGAAEIQVLMCAGKRVGKTSIMAAMQDNMDNQFPDGSVSVSIEQQSTAGNDLLDAFRHKQMAAFRDDWKSPFYYAEESNQTGKAEESTATQETNIFVGEIRVKNAKGEYKLVNSISFRDPRGEDFGDDVSADRRKQVMGWIRESQVIIIAIDTPRLMECDENGKVGGFHDGFNKPEEITNFIKQAWQGDEQERLILFVPLKCELYLREGRGEEIISRVQEGYKSLITYIRTTSRAALCSMAIVPCETMGGLEFRKFERLGGYVEGKKPGMFRSVYGYRRYENGKRAFRPKNCEQPLLYMLMFIFGMRQKGKTSGGIFQSMSKMPAYQDLAMAHGRIAQKCIRSEKDGFFILNDPQGFLNSREA
ncbi:MAG: hypothetical protein IJ313_05175 [Clostridia bacterium]|nr:hypothetical protein [Clostridia bacterium]